MNMIIGLIATCLIGYGLLASPSVAGSAEELDGKELFKDNKCGSCHSITAAGMTKASDGEDSKDKKAPDLSTIGSKHKADWMAKYLLKKETLDGDKHVKKFKGSDDELQVLVAWLETLKKK